MDKQSPARIIMAKITVDTITDLAQEIAARAKGDIREKALEIERLASLIREDCDEMLLQYKERERGPSPQPVCVVVTIQGASLPPTP